MIKNIDKITEDLKKVHENLIKLESKNYYINKAIVSIVSAIQHLDVYRLDNSQKE